jgi:hypothetical protein
MTDLAKDGKVDVYTYDRKWHFEVHFGNRFHYVAILNKKSAVYGITNAILEELGIDIDGWDCRDSWISLFEEFNNLYRNGYTYLWNDALKKCLHDLCEDCDLNIHFTEWTDDETAECGWFVCNNELYHQLHLDEDAYFVFREDTIDEVCEEVNGTCDRILQKVAMQYPDGSIDFDEAYVVIGDPCYNCNPIGIE